MSQIYPSDMKPCICCKQVLPMSEYYKHSQMKDGHLNKCKVCCIGQAKDRRFGPKREAILEFDRTRPHRQAKRVGCSEKIRAHNALVRAVARGVLTRPSVCPVCGNDRRIEAHHPDYTKPLYIEWLCSACHKQLHVRLKEKTKSTEVASPSEGSP